MPIHSTIDFPNKKVLVSLRPVSATDVLQSHLPAAASDFVVVDGVAGFTPSNQITSILFDSATVYCPLMASDLNSNEETGPPHPLHISNSHTFLASNRYRQEKPRPKNKTRYPPWSTLANWEESVVQTRPHYLATIDMEDKESPDAVSVVLGSKRYDAVPFDIGYNALMAHS